MQKPRDRLSIFEFKVPAFAVISRKGVKGQEYMLNLFKGKMAQITFHCPEPVVTRLLLTAGRAWEGGVVLS